MLSFLLPSQFAYDYSVDKDSNPIGNLTNAQADALTRVAGALATAGRREQAAATARRAETVARLIPDPFEQARVLALITEALIWNADVQSAYRVAAATCTTGVWTTAARPVLLLTASPAMRVS